jgi:hypothetical protein
LKFNVAIRAHRENLDAITRIHRMQDLSKGDFRSLKSERSSDPEVKPTDGAAPSEKQEGACSFRLFRGVRTPVSSVNLCLSVFICVQIGLLSAVLCGSSERSERV